MQNPAGTQKSELQRLRNKAEQIARLTRTTHLTEREGWKLYRSIYLPSITYGTTGPSLKPDEYDKVQQAVIPTILTKLRFNRNTPREIIFGPDEMMGLGLRDLYVHKGTKTTLTVIRAIRAQSEIGKLIEIILDWAQLIAGVGFYILQDTKKRIPKIEGEVFVCLLTPLRCRAELWAIKPLQRGPEGRLLIEVNN
jgi:hypothetical protein